MSQLRSDLFKSVDDRDGLSSLELRCMSCESRITTSLSEIAPWWEAAWSSDRGRHADTIGTARYGDHQHLEIAFARRDGQRQPLHSRNDVSPPAVSVVANETTLTTNVSALG